MVQTKSLLCCFDIDNTLVYSNVPNTEGVLEALSMGFNRQLREIQVSRKAATAMAVAKEYLEANNITRENTEDYDAKIKKSKQAFMSIVKQGIKSGRFFWKPLPNVIKLLKVLSQKDDFKLALLSANPREIAKMKLKNAGIDVSIFMEEEELFGAFGCEDESRSELVKKLWTRYCRISGLEDEPLDPSSMVIIGDTPNDIACAHDNHVPCVAVATGEYSAEDLREAEIVLRNFEGIKLNEIFLKTSF